MKILMILFTLNSILIFGMNYQKINTNNLKELSLQAVSNLIAQKAKTEKLPLDVLYENFFNKLPFDLVSPIKQNFKDTYGLFSTPSFSASLKGHTGTVTCLTRSNYGPVLYSGSDDKKIRVWNIKNNTCLKILEGHQNCVSSLLESKNGLKIFSGSQDNTIRIWDTKNGQCLKVIPCDSPVRCLCENKEQTKLYSGSSSIDHSDTTIKIWDITSGLHLDTLPGHTKSIWSLLGNKNDSNLYSASEDASIKKWNIEMNACEGTLLGHQAGVLSLAKNKNDTFLCSGSRDNSIKIWDLRSHQCIKNLNGHEGYIICLALSKDNKKLFSGSRDKTIKIWDIESEKCLYTLNAGHRWLVNSLSAIDNNLYSGSDDNLIKKWSLWGNFEDVYNAIQNHE